jgi:hypothetical protein
MHANDHSIDNQKLEKKVCVRVESNVQNIIHSNLQCTLVERDELRLIAARIYFSILVNIIKMIV